jgi:hypothetical protein
MNPDSLTEVVLRVETGSRSRPTLEEVLVDPNWSVSFAVRPTSDEGRLQATKVIRLLTKVGYESKVGYAGRLAMRAGWLRGQVGCAGAVGGRKSHFETVLTDSDLTIGLNLGNSEHPATSRSSRNGFLDTILDG